MHDGLTELGEWASHWIAADRREFVETPAREVDEAIRRSTHAGRPLGSKEFVQRLENATGRRLTPGKGGRPKKCVEAAAILWGVS